MLYEVITSKQTFTFIPRNSSSNLPFDKKLKHGYVKGFALNKQMVILSVPRDYAQWMNTPNVPKTFVHEMLRPSVPNRLRCSFSGILTSNIDLLLFRFLSSIVICRESFLSGAMPIIGFLSILNPIRIRINRPFAQIRQSFQRPIKSSIRRQVEDHRELVAHKVENRMMVLIGLRCFLLTCNVEYMQSRRLRASNLSNRCDFEAGYNSWIYYYCAYFRNNFV